MNVIKLILKCVLVLFMTLFIAFAVLNLGTGTVGSWIILIIAFGFFIAVARFFRKSKEEIKQEEEERVAEKEKTDETLLHKKYFNVGLKIGEKIVGVEEHVANLKQKNFLKRRFHEKKKLVSETNKHRADLTHDLNKGKNTQDEILEEFFAGISLDMKAVDFSEAKEITLEHLQGAKVPKKQKAKPTQKTQKVAT